MNINEILEMFPDEEKAKIDKFYSNIIVAQGNIGNVSKVIEVLSQEKLAFKKLCDLRTLTIEAGEIVDKIAKYKENNLFDIIKADISCLRYKAEIICDRVLECSSVGKSYKDTNGKLHNFIINDDEWERVALGLNLEEGTLEHQATIDDIYSEMSDKEKIYRALNEENVVLNFEGLDRYSRLMGMFESVVSALKERSYFALTDIDLEIEKVEYVIKCLVSDNLLTDVDIISTALISCTFIPKYKIASMKETIEEVLVDAPVIPLAEPFANLESSGMSR